MNAGTQVSSVVIAGLDPAIHPSSTKCFVSMDARVKPAHDESGNADAADNRYAHLGGLP